MTATLEQLHAIDAELSVLRAATSSRSVSRLSLALVIDGIRARVADVVADAEDVDAPIPFCLTEHA